jgi:hypothetical protein
MPIEAISIMYVGVGFLLVLLFCKALEIVVERAATLFVGKKKDIIDLLRMEINALNIKFDALRIKLDGQLDALKIEVNALDRKVESTAKVIEQLSLGPALPTLSRGMLVDNSSSDGQLVPEDTWTRDTLVSNASIAPTIDDSSSHDTWDRDTLVSNGSIAPTIDDSSSHDTWTRDILVSDASITRTSSQVKSEDEPSSLSRLATTLSPDVRLVSERATSRWSGIRFTRESGH